MITPRVLLPLTGLPEEDTLRAMAKPTTQCVAPECEEQRWDVSPEGHCFHHAMEHARENGACEQTARGIWSEARRLLTSGDIALLEWFFPYDPDRKGFSGMTFDNEVSILGEFQCPCYFKGVHFKKRARFLSCKFTSSPKWRGGFVPMLELVDRSPVQDGHAELAAYFNRAVFDGSADFSRSQFDVEAVFEGAQFAKTVAFEGVLFGSAARFAGVSFGADAGFVGASFQERVTFYGVTWRRGSTLAFSLPGKLGLLGRLRHVVAEANHAFDPQIHLHHTGSRFLDMLLRTLDWGFVAVIKTFCPDGWPFRDPTEGEALYRAAKSAAEENGNYRLAGLYHYAERCANDRSERVQWAWRVWHPWQFLSYWIGGFLLGRCLLGYGEKPHRSLIAGTVLIVIWAFLYFLSAGIAPAALADNSREFADYTPGFLDCLHFSAVTFTTLGYGDWHPKLGVRMLADTEAFAGAAIMAIFVVGLVKKFARS